MTMYWSVITLHYTLEYVSYLKGRQGDNEQDVLLFKEAMNAFQCKYHGIFDGHSVLTWTHMALLVGWDGDLVSEASKGPLAGFAGVTGVLGRCGCQLLHHNSHVLPT